MRLSKFINPICVVERKTASSEAVFLFMMANSL